MYIILIINDIFQNAPIFVFYTVDKVFLEKC